MVQREPLAAPAVPDDAGWSAVGPRLFRLLPQHRPGQRRPETHPDAPVRVRGRTRGMGRGDARVYGVAMEPPAARRVSVRSLRVPAVRVAQTSQAAGKPTTIPLCPGPP